LVMAEKSIRCRGANATILLCADKMVIRSSVLGSLKPYEIPITTIRAVVVDRKSVVPFTAMTILAAVITVLASYNALWFLINLTSTQIELVTRVGFTVTILCAIPMMVRAMFVNVIVRSNGDAVVLMARLVPLRSAKGLAKRFRELSVTS
jgi:hypothetical protein